MTNAQLYTHIYMYTSSFLLSSQVNESYDGSYRIWWDPITQQNPMGFRVTDRLSVPTEKNIFLIRGEYAYFLIRTLGSFVHVGFR